MQGAYLYSSKARKRHSDWLASEQAGSDNERKVTQKWPLRSRESIQELYYVAAAAAAARLVNRAARSVGRPVCRPVDHDSAEYKSDQSILRKTCPHSQSVPPSSSFHSSRRPRVFFWQRRRKRRFLFRILSIRVLELGELYYSKLHEVARSRTFVLCGPGARPNQIQLAYAFYTH